MPVQLQVKFWMCVITHTFQACYTYYLWILHPIHTCRHSNPFGLYCITLLDIAICGVANATGFGLLATNLPCVVASLATAISIYYFIYFFHFLRSMAYDLPSNVTIFWFGLYRRLPKTTEYKHLVLNSSDSHRLQIEIIASHTCSWNCGMQSPLINEHAKPAF